MTSRRQTKSPCDSLHFFTTSTYIDFSRNRNKKADNDYNDYSNKKTLTLMRVVSKLYVHKTCSAIDQAAIKDRRKIVSDVPNAKDTSKGNNPYIASLHFNSVYRYPYALARFAFNWEKYGKEKDGKNYSFVFCSTHLNPSFSDMKSECKCHNNENAKSATIFTKTTKKNNHNDNAQTNHIKINANANDILNSNDYITNPTPTLTSIPTLTPNPTSIYQGNAKDVTEPNKNCTKVQNCEFCEDARNR